MKIINFEKAKARKHSKEKIVKYIPEVENGELNIQRQYQELVQFFEHWYDEHVVGQDKNGMWVYK